jgi:dipeptidyl aminopeptidase/acylaminoacyl peptidase
VAAIVLAGVLLVAGYGAAGAVIYDRLSKIEGTCDDKWPGNTPASFQPERWVLDNFGEFDTRPYFVGEFEDVSFPSRDPNVTISGWFMPSSVADAPAVVIVHGLGGCKRDQSVLIPAGMLHRAGFAVLLLDMRDHGASTYEDGRFAGGTEEYQDVLGGWDWLVEDRGVPAGRVGLMGVSLGAGTVVVAGAKEGRVAAIWEDSGWAEIESAVSDYLDYKGYPTFVAPAGPFVARLISGDDLSGPSPIDIARVLNGRPLFITHGTADETVRVHQAEVLASAIRDAGGSVDPWILDGVEHAWAMLREPAEYERRLVEFFDTALAAPAAP